MKNAILICLCIFGTFWSKAQSPKFHWAKESFANSSQAIAVDSAENVYLTGSFSGTRDFDFGTGVFNLTSVGANDVFVAKYDNLGNFVWAKSFGNYSDDLGVDIKTDNKNNLLVTGNFLGTIDFDSSGTKKFIYSNGGEDVFILKLDPNGNYKWCKNLGGLSRDRVIGIALDSVGNVYTSGSTYQGDFDPGPKVVTLPPTYLPGVVATYISKLDSNGNYVWARYFSSSPITSASIANAIDVDKSGNVFVCGLLYGTVDFNPSGGGYTLVQKSLSGADYFIAKLKSNGTFAWAKNINSPGHSHLLSTLKVDDSSNAYMLLRSSSLTTITTDCTPPSLVFPEGLALLKLDSMGCFKKVSGLRSVAHSFFDNSIKVALDSKNNIISSFSIVTKHDVDPSADTFFIYPKGNHNIAVTKISQEGNLIWVYQLGDTLYNYPYGLAVSKRDNIFTTGVFNGKIDFDPSIDTSYSSSSIGGAFIHKMSNCQSNSSLFTSACNSFKLGTKTYTLSGIYKPFFVAKNGCDSIVTLNLAITKTNDTVTKSGSTLTAKAIGVGYQWVKCPSFAIIPGATSKIYIPTVTGDYAVIIKDGICIDTSDCISTWGLGMEEKNNLNEFIVFPNPSTEIININGLPHRATIIVYNLMGQEISIQVANTNNSQISIHGFASGLYFVQIKTIDGKVYNTKFRKE